MIVIGRSPLAWIASLDRSTLFILPQLTTEIRLYLLPNHLTVFYYNFDCAATLIDHNSQLLVCFDW
jgi:hypothetical protein